jgi:hypothetical protein
MKKKKLAGVVHTKPVRIKIPFTAKAHEVFEIVQRLPGPFRLLEVFILRQDNLRDISGYFFMECLRVGQKSELLESTPVNLTSMLLFSTFEKNTAIHMRFHSCLDDSVEGFIQLEGLTYHELVADQE